MNKLFIAYILGVLSFVLVATGVFSLLLSIPGLFLAVNSLKDRKKRITIPIGYQGKVGKKNFTAVPFMTTKYVSYIAIGLNVFSIVLSLFATAIVAFLFTIGAR